MFLELTLAIIALVLGLMLTTALIYLYVRVFRNENDMERNVNEIKSKIGSIIRDINTINRIEYENDVTQQVTINDLQKSVLNHSKTSHV